jgi:hypothetical protein
MANLNTFCVGNGTILGAGQTAVPCREYNGRYLWILEVAWNGEFTGQNEAADGRLVAPVRWRRGKENYINHSGSGLEAVRPGELSFNLKNFDGRYDPYDPTSVVYGISPQGLEVKLSVAVITTGTPGEPYPVFKGYITSFTPVSGSDHVNVTCKDELENLSNQDLTTDLKFNIPIHEAIQTVLDGAGISDYDLEPGTMPLTLFSMSNENALSVLNELANASLGQIFVTKSGKVRYYPINYGGMATYNIDQANVWKEFPIAQPWDGKRTHIKVSANRWARTQVKVLWSSPQDIALVAGGSKTFDVEFSGTCQPIQLDPNKGDYTLWGNGTTRYITATISNITASGCTVTITNNGPYPGSTYIKIRGRQFVQSYASQSRGYIPWQTWVPTSQKQNSTKVICKAGDDSIPQKKRSYFVLDSPYLHDAGYAQAWADLLKTHLENGAKNPRITLQTYSIASLMYAPELFDVIHYSSAAKNIDNDFYLGHIEGQWLEPNGQDVLIRFSLINHLVSNTAVAPEGITEINDEVPEDGGGGGDGNQPTDGSGNPILPPPIGADCPSNAPANGPFGLGATGIYYNIAGQNYAIAAFSGRARGAVTHLNPTSITIAATAESTEDGLTWTPCPVPPLSVNLYQNSNVIFTMSMSNGTAVLNFGGTRNITSVSVGIETGAPIFNRGEAFGSGTSNANDAAWKTGPSADEGVISVVPTSEFNGGSGNVGEGLSISADGFNAMGSFYDKTIENEWIESFYDWPGGTIRYRPRDTIFHDNSGTASGDFHFAIATGSIRVTVTNFTISNVCPAV